MHGSSCWPSCLNAVAQIFSMTQSLSVAWGIPVFTIRPLFFGVLLLRRHFVLPQPPMARKKWNLKLSTGSSSGGPPPPIVGALNECNEDDSDNDEEVESAPEIEASDSVSQAGSHVSPKRLGDRKEPPPEGGNGRPCWAACGCNNATVNISAGSKLGTWLDVTCYAAWRAWKLQMSTLQLMKVMTDLKRRDPDLYKKKIRSLRIVGESDIAAGADGVSSKADQEDLLQFFVERTKNVVSVRDDDTVLWCTHRQYLAHAKRVENFPNDVAANVAWLADKADPDVQKTGEGANLRIAVLGVPKTVGSKGITAVSPPHFTCVFARVRAGSKYFKTNKYEMCKIRFSYRESSTTLNG